MSNAGRLFFLIAAVLIGSSLSLADEQGTVALSLSVTNPSNDEPKDVDFKTELPEELRRADIVSTDGLDIVYDDAIKTHAVQGKVNLQPGETTFYRIMIRDIWFIPLEEIAALESKASDMASPETRDPILRSLEKIRTRQGQGYEGIPAHIAIYRENQKEIKRIKKELEERRAVLPSVRKDHHAGFFFGIIFAGVLSAVTALLLIARRMKRSTVSPDDFRELSDEVKVDSVLLPQANVMPSPFQLKMKEKGFTVCLEQRYPAHTALEMKLTLPGEADAVALTGFVVRQAPFTENGKVRFQTAFSVVEIAESSYKKLDRYLKSL
jgi:hypothetical protein